jgi:hypothetical protein
LNSKPADNNQTSRIDKNLAAPAGGGAKAAAPLADARIRQRSRAAVYEPDEVIGVMVTLRYHTLP